MKFFLRFFIAAVCASQVIGAKLNVTIIYETLCRDSMAFFHSQLWPAYEDVHIQENIFVELVPFGRAQFTEHPWRITCQHGPKECLGNVLDACFYARNPDNYKQVAMVSCTMSESFPPGAGEKCAKKLGYSYEGVKKCSTDKEGIQLQIKNGRRTLDFKPKITFIPTIVYDNVYNEKDQKESLTNFKAVVLRKLHGGESTFGDPQ